MFFSTYLIPLRDNSSKNIEPSSLLNTAGSTELERMQQLAKLVHSMQLVHDHVQSNFNLYFYFYSYTYFTSTLK